MPYYKSIIGFGIIAAIVAAFLYGRHVESLEWAVAQDKAIIEQQEENRLALLAYAESIVAAGVQHDKDQNTINELANSHERVRIKFPVCQFATGDAASISGKNISAGILPNEVDANFAELQDEVGKIILQCDQLNIDTIRLNKLQHTN